MSEPSPDSAPAFTLFPKLPLKLRHQIWDYHLPAPRVVDIRWAEDTIQYFTFARVPARAEVFQTNQESRAYALGKISAGGIRERRSFRREQRSPLGVCPRNGQSCNPAIHPFRARTKFERDTLHFASCHLSRFRDRHQGCRVATTLGPFLRRLVELGTAVQYVAFEARTASANQIPAPLSELNDLREVTLIYEDDCCKLWD